MNRGNISVILFIFSIFFVEGCATKSGENSDLTEFVAEVISNNVIKKKKKNYKKRRKELSKQINEILNSTMDSANEK